jgi:Domain of unknown function (DUF4407)
MSDSRFSSIVSWPRGLAYVIAAVVAGVVVGDLAAMLIFAGSSDRRLDEEAMRSANSTSAVVAASNDLERARQARADLDHAIEEASRERDEADTAIAVKRAEVRATVESMWAEHELASARMAVAAQTEIHREEQRRRVAAVLEAPTPVSAERVSVVSAESPTELEAVASIEAPSDQLPAVRESRPEKRTVLPTVPDVAGAAMRWMRPFVPPIIATAIDTTTKPLHSARQVFEETEEIHFGLRRSHRVTVTSEETAEPEGQWVEATRVEASRAAPVVESTTAIEGPKRLARNTTRSDRRQLPSSEG